MGRSISAAIQDAAVQAAGGGGRRRGSAGGGALFGRHLGAAAAPPGCRPSAYRASARLRAAARRRRQRPRQRGRCRRVLEWLPVNVMLRLIVVNKDQICRATIAGHVLLIVCMRR